MRRVSRAVAVVVAGLFLVAGGAIGSPASAHSEVVSTNPAQGARLEQMPAQIALTFSTAMKSPATFALTAPDGSRLTLPEPLVADRTITVAVPATDQQGTFSYAFRAFSSDGHQVTGQVSFTVGNAASAPPPGSASASSSAGAASPSTGSATPSTTTPSDSSLSQGSTAAADAAGSDGFWARHWWQVLVGVLLFAGAAALEFAARRSPQR